MNPVDKIIGVHNGNYPGICRKCGGAKSNTYVRLCYNCLLAEKKKVGETLTRQQYNFAYE